MTRIFRIAGRGEKYRSLIAYLHTFKGERLLRNFVLSSPTREALHCIIFHCLQNTYRARLFCRHRSDARTTPHAVVADLYDAGSSINLARTLVASSRFSIRFPFRSSRRCDSPVFNSSFLPPPCNVFENWFFYFFVVVVRFECQLSRRTLSLWRSLGERTVPRRTVYTV